MFETDRPGTVARCLPHHAEGVIESLEVVEIEKKNADACAIDIMNRDEAQFKFSPIRFFSAFMVTSTQAIFEKILPSQGPANHPAPKERLTNAYEANLRFIEQSPDRAKYKATLEGVYQHFGSLVPK
jgi:hypothetical protein